MSKIHSEIEKLTAEVNARLVRERKAEEEVARKSPPPPGPNPDDNPNAKRFFTGGSSPRHAAGVTAEKLPPGIRFARTLRAAAIAAKGGLGAAGVVRVMHDTFRDPETARYLEEYQARALEAGVPTAGGFLVPEDFSSEIVPLLRENTAVMKLGAREVPMPNGNLIIPRHTAGSTVSYVGEAAAASSNATKPATGQLRLSAKIAKAIVAISTALLRTAGISTDQWVLDDLVSALAVKRDHSAILGKGTQFAPRGVVETEGITAVTVGAAVTADTPTKFLKELLDANVGMQMRKMGWIFNPTLWEDFVNLKDSNGNYYYRAEMAANKLLNIPYEISQQIPNGSAANNPTHLILGDFNELIIGTVAGMEIDMSSEAAYKDENGNLVGAYDQYEMLIRVIDQHDIGIRQLATFAVAANVHTS